MHGYICSKMKVSIEKFIPAFSWFIISLVLLTLPGSVFLKKHWLDDIQFDKMVHIGLFSILVFLSFIPLINVSISLRKKKSILVCIALIAFAYGILMEFVQKHWVTNRSFDVLDILADGIGSFLPLIFFKRIISWGRK